MVSKELIWKCQAIRPENTSNQEDSFESLMNKFIYNVMSFYMEVMT